MNKDNNLGRVLALLSLTLLMSFGLYSLPDTLFGYKIIKGFYHAFRRNRFCGFGPS